MDTQAIVAALQAEISRLQSALSILAGGTAVKRRGRPRKDTTPPDWVTGNAAAPEKSARKKRHFSPAQRKAAAERMRQMWAKKKKAAKKS